MLVLPRKHVRVRTNLRLQLIHKQHEYHTPTSHAHPTDGLFVIHPDQHKHEEQWQQHVDSGHSSSLSYFASCCTFSASRRFCLPMMSTLRWVLHLLPRNLVHTSHIVVAGSPCSRRGGNQQP